ncbi:MAG: PilZ domain-containing protein [Nitrospiraceae bacterium]|nr:MAG: PilZ domain-containing protein [Nitrospiraceae bacterium]
MNPEVSENRGHTRLILSYPLELTLFAPNLLDRSFTGYIKNLSTKGACIRLEDKYNRFDIIEQRDSWIELEIDVPHGERIFLNTHICWMRRDPPQQGYSILIGLEFSELTDWQVEQIERLAKIRNIDNRMIHNLYDQHMKQLSR